MSSVVVPPLFVPLLRWVSLVGAWVPRRPRVHDPTNAGPSDLAVQLHYPLVLIVKFIVIVFLIVVLILLRRCRPTAASEGEAGKNHTDLAPFHVVRRLRKT